jgi:rhodanese-related sulfurtransferase
MLEGLKKIFGMGPKVDLGQLILNGAVIVDVRTRGEYAGGHVEGSINIPLDQLEKNIDKLKKQKKPVVTCCASGMRSSSARRILESHGIEAYNGGSWMSVDNLA